MHLRALLVSLQKTKLSPSVIADPDVSAPHSDMETLSISLWGS